MSCPIPLDQRCPGDDPIEPPEWEPELFPFAGADTDLVALTAVPAPVLPRFPLKPPPNPPLNPPGEPPIARGAGTECGASRDGGMEVFPAERDCKDMP
jgi:hypothetical protein